MIPAFFIYGVAAWRLFYGSLAWAMAAFVLCALETLVVLITLPVVWSVVMPFAFVALINGVRGAVAMQKYPEITKA